MSSSPSGTAATPATTVEMLDRTAAAHPDRAALRRAGTGGPALSFAGLQAECEDLAMGLVDLGVVAEERIGLIEAYPSFNVDGFAAMIHLMRGRGAPPAFLHVDADLAALRAGRDDFARDMNQLAALCADERIPFGLIIWGGNGNADALYADSAMKLATAIQSAFGDWASMPDHLIVQSWAESATGRRITPTNLPENIRDTHTELLLRAFRLLNGTLPGGHSRAPVRRRVGPS